MLRFLFLLALSYSVWKGSFALTEKETESFMDFSHVDHNINKNVSRSRIERRREYMKEREARKSLEVDEWIYEDMDDFVGKML